jgi:GNAT superfamily N-acetyltransferase
MKIEYLEDRPEFIAELADLHFAEWGYLNPGETLEGKAYYLRNNCGRHGVPSFVIAVEGTELIGSASLIAQDMDNRPDLTPWLADVYVKPKFRRQGVATALIQRIEAEAKTSGIARLFTIHSRCGRSVSTPGMGNVRKVLLPRRRRRYYDQDCPMTKRVRRAHRNGRAN